MNAARLFLIGNARLTCEGSEEDHKLHFSLLRLTEMCAPSEEKAFIRRPSSYSGGGDKAVATAAPSPFAHQILDSLLCFRICNINYYEN